MDRAVAGTHARPRMRDGPVSTSIRGPERRHHAYRIAMRGAAAQQLLLRRSGNCTSDTAALARELRRSPRHDYPCSFPHPDRRLDTIAPRIVPFSLPPPPLKQPAIRVEKVGSLSSRPEEFHLRALPEPCMTLSSHTAPDVQPLP